MGKMVWHFFACLYVVYISSSMIYSQQIILPKSVTLSIFLCSQRYLEEASKRPRQKSLIIISADIYQMLATMLSPFINHFIEFSQFSQVDNFIRDGPRVLVYSNIQWA